MGRHSTLIPATAPTIVTASTTSNDAQSPPPSPTRKRKLEQTSTSEIEVDINAPEPPSKKALRKAKKAKSAHVGAHTDSKELTENHGAVDVGGATVANAQRSDHSIWIGNLSWTTTKAELRNFFLNNLELLDEEITRLHMPAPSRDSNSNSMRKDKSHNKGFAYVDFATEDALTKALNLSEKLFSGRKVLIKNAKSFEGRPKVDALDAAERKTSGKPPSTRIFVGNLSFDATTDELKGHFQRCGDIENVHVATFEDSGKCKGYAWIEFADVAAAQAAVRGWTEFTRQESEEEEDESGENNDNGLNGVKSHKKPKPRKWWVNRFQGRPLRMEFAEGKDVRYKKRFGKKGTMREQNEGQGDVHKGPILEYSEILNRAAHDQKPANEIRKPNIDARSIKPGAALAAAPRLTGSIVESQGRKTILD